MRTIDIGDGSLTNDLRNKETDTAQKRPFGWSQLAREHRLRHEDQRYRRLAPGWPSLSASPRRLNKLAEVRELQVAEYWADDDALAVLSTKWTMLNNFYTERLEAQGIFTDTSRARYVEIIKEQKARGADAVALS